MDERLLFACGVVIFLVAVYCVYWMASDYIKRKTHGDEWNHKGVLHITHDEDGTYMSLELDNALSLSEIEQNSQVIFDVKVHDARSR